MSKHINRLFEAFTPTTEQKETLFQHIVAQSRSELPRNSGFAPAKRWKLAALVAVLTVCVTTTAFAAAYMGLDGALFTFLHPVNEEQAEYLAKGAYRIDEQVVNEKGTLTIKQVIGDSNLTYLLMDFTAPEGTVLNAARYRFEYVVLDTDQSYHGTGFQVLDDGNPDDNTITLLMNIMSKHSIAGQTVHLQFNDLQAADPLPGIFHTVIPGSWETVVQLDFKEYSTLYPVDQNITMFGYEAVVKSVSVSPISIALKLESSSLKEINEAAGKLKAIDDYTYLDDYPVTINYKDGTSETTSIFTGLHLTEFGTQMLTIKTFEQVINDEEIASIVFFDKEIPLRR